MRASTKLLLLQLLLGVFVYFAQCEPNTISICRVQLDSLFMLSTENIWGEDESEEMNKLLGKLFASKEGEDKEDILLTEKLLSGYEKLMKHIISLGDEKNIGMLVLEKLENYISENDNEVVKQYDYPLKSANKVWENKIGKFGVKKTMPLFFLQYLWEMASNIQIHSQLLPSESNNKMVFNRIRDWLVFHLIAKFEAIVEKDKEIQKEKGEFVRTAMRIFFKKIININNGEQLFKVGFAFRPSDTAENNLQTEAMVEEMADLVFKNVYEQWDHKLIKEGIQNANQQCKWNWMNKYKFSKIIKIAYEKIEKNVERRNYKFVSEIFKTLNEKVKLKWLSIMSNFLWRGYKTFDKTERMVNFHVWCALPASIVIPTTMSSNVHKDNDQSSLWTIFSKVRFSLFQSIIESVSEHLLAIIFNDELDTKQITTLIRAELINHGTIQKYEVLPIMKVAEKMEKWAEMFEWLEEELQRIKIDHENESNNNNLEIEKDIQNKSERARKLMFYYIYFGEVKLNVQEMENDISVDDKYYYKSRLNAMQKSIKYGVEKQMEIEKRNIGGNDDGMKKILAQKFKELLSNIYEKIKEEIEKKVTQMQQLTEKYRNELKQILMAKYKKIEEKDDESHE